MSLMRRQWSSLVLLFCLQSLPRYDVNVVLVTTNAHARVKCVKLLKEPYKDWAETNIQKIRSILDNSRSEHTQAVKDRINSVEQMKDVVSLTQGLFAISKVCLQASSGVRRGSQMVHIPRRPPSSNQMLSFSAKRLL